MEKKNIIFKCDECTKVYKGKSSLNLHVMTIHRGIFNFPCQIEGCGKQYAEESRLIKHMCTHQAKTVLCNECGASFVDARQLASHKVVHLQTKPFKCNITGCGKTFARSGDLSKHKKRHTGQKHYKCDFPECLFAGVEKGDVDKHKQVHEKKEYRCDFTECSFITNFTGSLRTHKKSHSEERSFLCDVINCLKSFKTQSLLTIHSRIHTGQKDYICKFGGCTKAFSTSGDLVKHAVIHDKDREKNFKCEMPDCDAVFATKRELHVHGVVHSDAKPFKCETANCGYSAKRKSALLVHMTTTHSDERPFPCEHCPYASKTKADLKYHMDRHEEQKNYEFECKMQHGTTEDWDLKDGSVKCWIRCKTKLDMQVHIANHHTEEGIAKKLKSEQKFAEFLTENDIPSDRDWTNYMNFKMCAGIEGGSKSARPDFFFPAEIERLNAIVLAEIDEMQHPNNLCELRRMQNIYGSIQQTEYCGKPVLYFRINPHHFRRNGKFYDRSLQHCFELFLTTLKSITSVKPGLNLVYIQYDGTDECPDIFRDDEPNEYAKALKECVILNVY